MNLFANTGGADPRRTTLGGAFFLTLAGITTQLINSGVHIGLARVFSPGLYGMFGIVASTLSVLEVITRWGLARAVAFYVARDHDVAREVFKKSLRLQAAYALACFALLFLLADQLGVALGDQGLSAYLRLCSFFVLTFACVPVYAGLFHGLGAFRQQAGVSIIGHIAQLLFLLAFLAGGMGIYGVVVAYVLSPLVATGYAIWSAHPIPRAGRMGVAIKDIVGFGSPVFISTLVISLLMRIDLFMVQSLLADRVLTGLYTSASSLVKVPYFLSLSGGLVLFQVVARLRTQSLLETREFISRCVRYYLICLVPVPFILYGSAEEILRFIFGSAYLLSAPPFRILTFSFIFMVLCNVIITFIAALNQARIGMGLSLLLLPVQVLLIYHWVFTKGLIGVAAASTVTWALGTFLGALYLWREGYIVLPGWKTVLNVGIACLCSYYLAVWVSPSGLWLLLSCPLIYLVYFIVLRVTGEISNGEIQALLTLLPARSR